MKKKKLKENKWMTKYIWKIKKWINNKKKNESKIRNKWMKNWRTKINNNYTKTKKEEKNGRRKNKE